MKKMDAKVEKSKKDMASDKKMVGSGKKGYALGGAVPPSVPGNSMVNRLMKNARPVLRSGGSMVGRLMGRAKPVGPTPAAPAPAPAPAAAPAAAPAPAPVQTPAPAATRPGYAYGGKVDSGEKAWVKSVQKRAGYNFGGMVKKGKKGC